MSDTEMPVDAGTEDTSTPEVAETDTPQTDDSGADAPQSTSAEPTQTEVKNAAKQAEKQIKEALKRYKVKIDDKEVEVDENELLAGYQMRKASQKRFDEAARLKKDAEQKLEYLKKNPAKALEDMGLDVRALAEGFLLEKLEEEEMTPDQKKIKEYERKLRTYEEEQKRVEDQKRQEEDLKLRQHFEEDYSKKIKDALDTGGLPKTPSTVKRMAQLMAHALENGYELEPKDVVGIIKEDYMSDIRELIGSADGETLLGLLGKDVSDKIRKTELAKVKAKQPPTPARVTEVASPAKTGEKPSPKRSMADFRKEMNDLLKK